MVKDTTHLENAFAIGHDVLQDTIWGGNHPNFSDRGQQLSRSARALKIWMSVQTFGMAAFRNAVQQGLDLARQAEAYAHASPLLEVMTPVSLGILCFRVNPREAARSEETLEQINRVVACRPAPLRWSGVNAASGADDYSVRHVRADGDGDRPRARRRPASPSSRGRSRGAGSGRRIGHACCATRGTGSSPRMRVRASGTGRRVRAGRAGAGAHLPAGRMWPV